MSARATEFLIWRVASSVDWDCSVQDIADELGVHIETVRAAFKRRGWYGRIPKGPRGYTGRTPVDWTMRHSAPNWTGRA